MHAYDCSDPMHEEAHIIATTGDVLIEKVLRHFAHYHPDVGEEDVREMVVAAAYVETPGAEDEDDLAEGSATAPPRAG